MTPPRVVDDVDASEVNVDGGDGEEVDAHDEVADRQVGDEERVHLTTRNTSHSIAYTYISVVTHSVPTRFSKGQGVN